MRSRLASSYFAGSRCGTPSPKSANLKPWRTPPNRSAHTNSLSRPGAGVPPFPLFLGDDFSGDWAMVVRRLRLSVREAEIIRCIIAEQKDRVIAAQLGISTHTVRSHLERIFRKPPGAASLPASAWLYVPTRHSSNCYRWKRTARSSNRRRMGRKTEWAACFASSALTKGPLDLTERLSRDSV